MKSLYNLLNAKGQMASLVLAVLCVAIVLGSIFSGLSGEGYEVGTDLVKILKDEDSTQTFDFFNMAIRIPIALILIAAIALIFFGLKSVVSDPKGSIKFIIGAVILAILFFIFQSMATPELGGKAAEIASKQGLSDTTITRIGGGIGATVLLIGLAIASAIVGGIANIFK